MSVLNQLKDMSVIVADTGDIEEIKKYQPQDATTNPSLLLKAAALPQYNHIVSEAKAWANGQLSNSSSEELLDLAVDKIAVDIGAEILDIIPGRVSTEIDAKLSFDTTATVERAKRIIGLYNDKGYSNDRVLIKIASTWEGIKAAEILEKEGIYCNLTLLFGMQQAKACADAGATLISPFVGRVLDWYKKTTGQEYAYAQEPGVLSVKEIYQYYKQHDYKTIIMAASFRNTGEIIELAGCDYLTISPSLLSELDAQNDQLERKLSKEMIQPIAKEILTEESFRWQLNADAMATEKLAEGIRGFNKDLSTLKQKL